MCFYKPQDVYDWIVVAESEFNARRGEMEKNRKYYENIQKPEGIPTDISFIVKNLCMQYVNLQVSKVVGGAIDKTLKGKDFVTPIQEQLLDDILEANKFEEFLIEQHANNFNVEGLGGWKVIYNPFKHGKYGLGFPEILNLNPLKGEILLDPNATDGTHRDDRARASKIRMPLKQAIRNPKWKKYWDEISESARESDGHQNERYVDIYEVEFMHVFYVPAFYDVANNSYFPVQDFVPAIDTEQYQARIGDINSNMESPDYDFTGDYAPNEGAIQKAFGLMPQHAGMDDLYQNTVLIEQEVYFTCKVINGDLMVEFPEPTEFGGFTIIPSFHTIQSYNNKYPLAPLDYLRDTQDRINSISSMMFMDAKKGLKNPVMIQGVTEKELIKMKRKIAGIGEIFLIDAPNAKITQLSSTSLTPALIQQFELDMQAFADVGNTNDPDRGQPVDLSGKAIVNLQARADLPMYVPSVHLASGLVELFRRLLECVQNKMDKPFVIERQIEGEYRKLYFNYPVDKLPEDYDPEYNFEMNGMINPAEMMEIPQIGVDIDTNTVAKEQIAIEKAMAMFNLQQLAPQHLHKAIFPEKWAETLQAATEWNAAMALATQLSQLSPDGQQLAGEEIGKIAMAEQTAAQLGFGNETAKNNIPG